MSLATAPATRPEFPARAVLPTAGTALVVVSAGALLVAALYLRVGRLGSLPGVNGDEAWMGVQAQRLLLGEKVAWRTPTGNPLNPLLFVPQLVLHAAFEPSFALLRVPALISGVLALAVNYFLCRRVFNRETAWATTLLLAVLPVNIAYSRFAWDACQSLLATLPPVYLALLALRQPARRTARLSHAAAAYALALLVHPTNIFVGPLLAVPAWLLWRDELAATARRWGGQTRSLLAACAALAIVALIWAGWPVLGPACQRMARPDQWVAFLTHFQRLFSGVTVYQYIAGSCQGDGACRLHDLFSVALMLLAAALWLRMLAAPGLAVERCLLLGWGLSVLGFFLVAGPAAMAPHFERYAVCLVGPTAIVLGRPAAWLGERSAKARKLAAGLGGAVCWLVLLGFHSQYLAHIERTGGTSHRAFRTAPVEPKQAALEALVGRPGRTGQTWVLADEWWSYWPLEYLAVARRDVRVVGPEAAGQEDFARASREGRAWSVEFTDGQRGGVPAGAIAICDAGGKPLLVLTRCESTGEPHGR